jgi:hypothetical protein
MLDVPFHESQSVTLIRTNSFGSRILPSHRIWLPSNFGLFGTLKGRLVKCQETTKEELFRNMTEVLNTISEGERIQAYVSEITTSNATVGNDI